VLRIAVHCLLALVLCMNGFLAPLAMAAHGDEALHAPDATQPSCHGMDESATPGDDEAPPPTDCCRPGHCLCACLVSAPRLDGPPPLFLTRRGDALAPPAAQVRIAARHPVPLRPPIG